MNKKLFIIIRILIWVVPILFLAWIGYVNIVPNGQLKITFNQDDKNGALNGFDSEKYYNNLQGNGSTATRDIIDPGAYFDLKTLRSFNEVDFNIMLDKTNSRIELAANSSNAQTLTHRILYLPEYEGYKDWHKLVSEEHILLQRSADYESIEEFLNSPPVAERLSVADADVGDTKMDNYKSANQKLYIRQPLRGTHVFYVYIKGETLEFVVNKKDLNEKTGPDRLTAYVYDSGDDLLYARTIEDDGDETPSQISREVQKLDIKLNDLDEGVYKVELAASAEVIINSIETNNLHVVLPERVRLHGTDGESSETNVSGYQLAIFNNNQVENNIVLNNNTLSLDPGEKIVKTQNEFSGGIKVNNSSIIVTTDGSFYFDGFEYFDHQYGQPILTRELADKIGIDYIYLRYSEPDINNDKVNAKTSLPLKELLKTEDGYRFYIQVSDESELPIGIGQINMTLKREPLTYNGVFDLIRQIFERF